jgi:hypothetical protein
MNLLTSPTLPTNGTNEVQRLTLTGAPTGGTFKLRFGSSVMPGTLPYNASAAAVQTALRALPTIGSTGVTCSGGPLDSAPVDVTFGGRLGRMDVQALQVVSPALVGGTSPAVTVSTVTPGVLGTQRSSVHGQILLYGTDIYINHGVPYAPDWQPYAPAGGGWRLIYDHAVPSGGENTWTIPWPLSDAADLRALRYRISWPAVSGATVDVYPVWPTAGSGLLPGAGASSIAMPLSEDSVVVVTWEGLGPGAKNAASQVLASVVSASYPSHQYYSTGDMIRFFTALNGGFDDLSFSTYGNPGGALQALPVGSRIEVWGLFA